MTFFFDKSLITLAEWCAADNDSVLSISRALWTSLRLSSGTNRVCLSITAANARGEPNSDDYILCEADLNEKADGFHVAVPSSWIKTYPKVFASGGDLCVKTATPPVLTSVVAVALTPESYSKANSDSALLEDAFFAEGIVLRQGDVLNIPLPTNSTTPLQYRLEMLEPALQGYATRGETELMVLSSLDVDQLVEDALDEEEDAIEINEYFLGSSILTTSAPQQPMNGHENSQGYNNARLSDLSHAGYALQSLSIREVVDDNCTLYLRTSDLGKIGILSGDWAVAAVKPTCSRLVRILANDHATASSGIASGSHLLLHNICADEVDLYAPYEPHVVIKPSPFGSLNPTIPTARSITIARVASPLSINRQYQNLFISSLKSYFDTNRKLVKQGDLIAVTIDTDASRFPPESENEVDEAEETATSKHPIGEKRSNEVVFFKVTNIEYDVISQRSVDAQDSYTGSTLGELGCWVDTSITRMIQTGIEYSRVPNMRSYLNLGENSSIVKVRGGLIQSTDSPKLDVLDRPDRFPHLLGPDTPFSQIVSLTSAALTQRAMDYDLQLSFLLKGGRGIGKFTVASWVAQRLGIHLFEVNCYDMLGENDTKTEATLQVRLEQAKSCTPCLLVLRHLEAFAQSTQASEPGKEPRIVNMLKESLSNMQTSWKLTGYPVIVLGTTSEIGRVPASLLSSFKQEIAFEAPGEAERLEIIHCLVADQKIASDVSLQNIATQTAALLAGDLRDLVGRAKAASFERALTVDITSLQQIPLIAADFDFALGKARNSYSESIGAPKIPTVTWDDVGGLAHVKTDILDTIQLPLEHPELFADGLKKRSGILLYGPPGTGKTLIAKAVATSCALNFFSVKGPELLNMYIGESEANVRRVFQRARDAKPCVIFFDELDSVAPKRGNHGDSGGVMDRIVSQLLAELDGMAGGSGGADVFVIGATNRPDLLDPALLRPGRFDRMLYLGVSDTHEAQYNILEALTRKFKLDPALDLRAVAEKCPFNYTGADFYALCSDAMLNAMSRKAEAIDAKIQIMNNEPPLLGHPHPITPQYYLAELATPAEISVTVSSEDFERALAMLVPSVSQAEMEHYAEVQRRFSQPKDKVHDEDNTGEEYVRD